MIDSRVIGEVPDSLPDYTEICPQCKTPLSHEDEGYGFAFGGGLGHYWTCPNEQCEWFVKWLDPKENSGR